MFEKKTNLVAGFGRNINKLVIIGHFNVRAHLRAQGIKWITHHEITYGGRIKPSLLIQNPVNHDFSCRFLNVHLKFFIDFLCLKHRTKAKQAEENE